MNFNECTKATSNKKSSSFLVATHPLMNKVNNHSRVLFYIKSGVTEFKHKTMNIACSL